MKLWRHFQCSYSPPGQDWLRCVYEDGHAHPADGDGNVRHRCELPPCEKTEGCIRHKGHMAGCYVMRVGAS